MVHILGDNLPGDDLIDLLPSDVFFVTHPERPRPRGPAGYSMLVKRHSAGSLLAWLAGRGGNA
jgi:hypothetical protein